jgi:uncharacterized protein YjbI with pentapeptide repeats
VRIFFRVLAIALGVGASSVALWKVSAEAGPFVGILVIAPWFVAWVISELIAEDRGDPSRSNVGQAANQRPLGLQFWYRISIWIATISALLAITLVLAMLHWDWIAGRVGGVLAPTATIVVAAIVSAGAARTVLAQTDNAERIRLGDEEGLLWKRFENGAQQFANETAFAIRAAGVYSLASLADDWIRHHRRLKDIGVKDRSIDAECATIVDLFCAHLRRRADRNTGLSKQQVLEAELVNEAIIGQFKTHLWTPAAGDAGEPGLWVGNCTLDLRDTDLSENVWPQIDLQDAMLRGADLYWADLRSANISNATLRHSDLRRAHLTGAKHDAGTDFDFAICDNETIWPEPSFQIIHAAPGAPFSIAREDGSIIRCWTVLRRPGHGDCPVWRVPTGIQHRQPPRIEPKIQG